MGTLQSTKTFTIELQDHKKHISKPEEIVVTEEIAIEHEKSPHKSFNIFEKIKNKFHFEKSHSDEKGKIFYIDIDGSYKDMKGRLVNENGQLIDADGNILEINLDEEENVKPDKEFLARFKNIFDWRGRKIEANEFSETNLVVEHDTDSNTLESIKTFTIE